MSLHLHHTQADDLIRTDAASYESDPVDHMTHWSLDQRDQSVCLIFGTLTKEGNYKNRQRGDVLSPREERGGMT